MASLLIWIVLTFGGTLGAVSHWELDPAVRGLIAHRFDGRLQHSSAERLQYNPVKRLQHSLAKHLGERGNLPKSLLEKLIREEHHPHDGRPQEEPRKPLFTPVFGIGLVNVLGSSLFGLPIATPTTDSKPKLIASSGLLASLTTPSTAVMDLWTLWRSGRRTASFALLPGVRADVLIALFFAFVLGRFILSAS